MAVGKWETSSVFQRRVFQARVVAGFSIAFSSRRTKLFRWLVSQTAVWTNGVVVNTPSLDLAPGICNRFGR